MEITAGVSEVAGLPWEPTDAEQTVTRVVMESMQTAQRMRAMADAVETRALALGAAVAREQTVRADTSSQYDFPFRSMASELAAVAGESKRAVQTRMANASVLVSYSPVTTQALADARITARHAAVIREHGERLADEQRAVFEERAVGFAEDASRGMAWGGSGCSSTPTPVRCSRSTDTPPPRRRDGSSEHGMRRAGSRPAPTPPSTPTSTTPARTPKAAPPGSAISPASARDVTATSTTLPGG
ncbi:hypothetical protein N8K70_03400 [Microbacterium betulae]|uniref:DUF222 domain-containing protein n=1 Tax=Microbacterium betulae TaxID=2981139 RepID=A0AA97FLQ4_9MICO|nr:hypothetical protein [Microbacterium sp. AB]WOF23737.1 hypothetical protein N8K70_03400 [Microbacterium sp. AB]